jgi:hypothetical protein
VATRHAAHGQRECRHAALDREDGGAHRHGHRRPEELDRCPAARQVAIADEPDRDTASERGHQFSPRFAQPDEPDPGPAARLLEVGLEPWVVERLHRDDGLTDAERHEQRRELDRAEVEPDEHRRVARDDRLGQDGRVVEREPLVEPPARHGRVAGDLHVIPRGVPEGRADQALERHGVGSGGTDGGTAAPRLREGDADALEVPPRLGSASRLQPIPPVPGQPGEPEQRPLGKPARDPRSREQDPAARRHDAASILSAIAAGASAAA